MDAFTRYVTRRMTVLHAKLWAEYRSLYAVKLEGKMTPEQLEVMGLMLELCDAMHNLKKGSKS